MSFGTRKPGSHTEPGFGFALSGAVQAWVPRARLERTLGGRGLHEVSLATGLGAVSFCSEHCKHTFDTNPEAYV